MTTIDPITVFCQSAEFIINDGLAFARVDDPNQFHAVHKHFDQGKARRRLVVDYLAGGQLRIALVLIGTRDGEERIVQMFETLVQGPQAPGAAH
jgi:hypothetical protein